MTIFWATTCILCVSQRKLVRHQKKEYNEGEIINFGPENNNSKFQTIIVEKSQQPFPKQTFTSKDHMGNSGN